jgi:DNA-binding MarR family transcriptional regulator
MTTSFHQHIDWLVHEPVRLSMMVLLAQQPRTFTELTHELGIPKGNVSTHTRRLEDVQYVVSLHADGHTTFTLTRDGREALVAYFETARDVVQSLARVLTFTARSLRATLTTHSNSVM